MCGGGHYRRRWANAWLKRPHPRLGEFSPIGAAWDFAGLCAALRALLVDGRGHEIARIPRQ